MPRKFTTPKHHIARTLHDAERDFLSAISDALEAFKATTGCYVTRVRVCWDKDTKEPWGGALEYVGAFNDLTKKHLARGTPTYTEEE